MSGSSGAALLGFAGFRPGPIEVVTRRSGTNRSPFARVRQSRATGRFVVVEGIRVVSPADCTIQLAATLDPGRLEVLVGEQAHRSRRFLDDLRDRYLEVAGSRLPGSPNVRAVLEAYGDGDAPPRNALEQRLRHLLLSVPNLPAVEWEATPPWSEPGETRVDALVPDWKLIVEADGRLWHTRVADFERDRERDNLAIAHGYRVLRFTWHALDREWGRCRRLLLLTGSAPLSPNVDGFSIAGA